MQLEVICECDTKHPGHLYVRLITAELDDRYFIYYDKSQREVYSSRNNLQVTFYVYPPALESSISCLVRPVPDTSDVFCGPSEINFTSEHRFNLTTPGNRFLHCVWRITNDAPSALTMVDLLGIHIQDETAVLGEGDDIGSSMIHNIKSEHKNGTSYYLSRSHLWMTFSSRPHEIVNATPTLQILFRSSNYINGKDVANLFQCGDDQILCRRDSKCLPLHSICDGQADCSDFLDEGMTCDFCGASSISLSSEESMTIIADFGMTSLWTGFFAIYPGTSPSFPSNTTDVPAGVVITNHSVAVEHRECIWRLQEPNGTRIQVEVAEFEGDDLVLTIGNGIDPTEGFRLLVIDTETGIVPLPRTLLSSGIGMWITLKESTTYLRSFKLRLVFSTYNTVDCDEGQFVCPSGRDCLEDSSLQCDGKRDCSANGDELGCGNCDPQEFLCSSGEDCVQGYQLCDGNADCADYTDELQCGFCGNETLDIQLNQTYFVAPYSTTMQCLWIIQAEPGYQIQARILRNSWCELTFATGPSTDTFNHGLLGSNIIWRVDTIPIAGLAVPPMAYPRSLSVRASRLWISNKCIKNSNEGYADKVDELIISVRQYMPLECSSKEFTCASGLACIDKTAVCDGIADCPEYSDEIGCQPCLGTEFACSSGECVALDKKCDGKKHCSDSSDEFDCDPCGKSIFNLTNDAPATITSPGWWEFKAYPDRAKCLWSLVSEVGFRITLTFLQFSVEEGYDCLYLGNGNGFTDYFLNVTGDRFPHSVASRKNTMFVKFVSDVIISAEGFRLQIEQKMGDEVLCDEGYVPCGMEDLVCVKNDASENGLSICPKDNCYPREYYVWNDPIDLTSPGYPANYPCGLDCVWTIISNKTKSILIVFLDFQTERSEDVLEIQGSTLHGGKAVVFRLRGACKVRTMAFNSYSAQVSFTSDVTVSFRGFHLQLLGNYSADNVTSCPYPDLFDCGDGSCVSPDARCDGFKDCKTDGSDELGCDNITCPEYFKCANSGQCLFWTDVCDGEPDCPNGDDETNLECGKRCPIGCDCDIDTAAVKCLEGWNSSTIENIARRTESLLLSGGNMDVLDMGLFKELSHLRGLWLASSNITGIVKGTFDGLQNLTYLNISENYIATIATESFLELNSLDTLIARDIHFDTIESKAFSGLTKLKTLVLIRSTTSKNSKPVVVKREALNDLVSLTDLYVDDYQLCCEFVAAIEGFELDNCQTTEAMPPLNLCGSLMPNEPLRVFLWVLAFSALIGNAVVIVWRCYQGKEKGGKKTHTFFVLNLAISDLIMGVYMLIIAGADVHYGTRYSQGASVWRASPVCKIAGVFSLLSSEASVFFVTLISLDSFVSIVFPFSRIQLRDRSAAGVVASIWVVALTLSVWPTVVSFDGSDVYGLSDVCIGLPLMTKPTSYVLQEAGITNPLGNTHTVSIPVGQGSRPTWIYSIALFLGLNLLCFLVVLCCYIAIFIKVKRTAKRVRQTVHRDREIKMAVKMALIVGTDFACWVPVIILGILSQTGVVNIGAEGYAWVVVLLLPINSSLNPYIYTLITAISEYRLARALREEKLVLTTTMKTRSMETLPSSGSDTAPS
ncbi:uncharacterized protein LOC119725388 [Patiria miniata]|uniref:G-protein coupled receptor GRL101 n=1 Tax=Patiria miniata TaxID=46514 RepID=A0A913ZLS5_PATMI|nr:uncharacterized protein LOC119725388 [Patiria miniata]